MSYLRSAELTLAIAVSIVSIGAGLAVADSLRCGNRVVSVGDSRNRVRTLCGEPDDVVRRTDTRSLIRKVPDPGCLTGAGQQPCTAVETYTRDIPIEQWTYNPGAGRLLKHLFFEEGALQRVETGTHGAD